MNSSLVNHAPGRLAAHSGPVHLIAIGASAGGPAALVRIITSLPGSFRSCLVIVQHVASPFAPALASWLGGQSALPVRIAEEGDLPAPGLILLAGRDRHLVMMNGGRLGYRIRPTDCSYRPSVDVFFESIVENWPCRATGVLLTGMGRDGARGLLRLREAGHHTIAQDRTTSAVYGMPKAAAELGAATEVVRLEQIGVRLHTLDARSLHAHV